MSRDIGQARREQTSDTLGTPWQIEADGDEMAPIWLLRNRAGVTVGACDLRELAEVIVDAVNAVYPPFTLAATDGRAEASPPTSSAETETAARP